jgi:hypothetical protein
VDDVSFVNGEAFALKHVKMCPEPGDSDPKNMPPPSIEPYLILSNLFHLQHSFDLLWLLCELNKTYTTFENDIILKFLCIHTYIYIACMYVCESVCFVFVNVYVWESECVCCVHVCLCVCVWVSVLCVSVYVCVSVCESVCGTLVVF